MQEGFPASRTSLLHRAFGGDPSTPVRVAAEQSTITFNTMAKPKRKLTAAQKEKKAQSMTIFINGKQKRVRRPILNDGLDPEEFYMRNADPIALHQDGLWECMADCRALESCSMK